MAAGVAAAVAAAAVPTAWSPSFPAAAANASLAAPAATTSGTSSGGGSLLLGGAMRLHVGGGRGRLIHTALGGRRSQTIGGDRTEVHIRVERLKGRLVLLLKESCVAAEPLHDPHGLIDVKTLGVGIGVEPRRGHSTRLRLLRGRGGDAHRVVHHTLDREVRHEGAYKIFLGERLLVGLPHQASLIVQLPPSRVECLCPVQVACHPARVALLLVNAQRADALAELLERVAFR